MHASVHQKLNQMQQAFAAKNWEQLQRLDAELKTELTHLAEKMTIGNADEWYLLLETINQHYQTMAAATAPYHQQVKQQLFDLRQKVKARNPSRNS